MKQIKCSGVPFELGTQHGIAAKDEIHGSLAFYETLFKKISGLSWSDVCEVATKFEPILQQSWPHLCEEMQGIATATSLPYTSILALNVRTEIAYGLSKDGCTALFHCTPHTTYLAQNWDWQTEQQGNLIALTLSQPGKPILSMITEGGIIGKIGLNDRGVGVCLNAIRAHGVDFGRLPVHLALRTCLESENVVNAVGELRKCGVASACHILVADPDGAIGLECSSIDIVELPSKGILTHTNHFVKSHPGVEDKMALQDSPTRLKRIDDLIEKMHKDINGDSVLRPKSIFSVLEDQDDFPTAICRSQTDDSSVATLFSVVIDLRARTAEVRIGRPSECSPDTLTLEPNRYNPKEQYNSNGS